MSDASVVLTLVHAARRRQRLVIFVRLALLAVPLAIAGAALVIWLVRPAGPGFGVALAIVATVALAGAAATSVSRTPAPREAAAALDRILELEDRLVTSMACLSEADPVGRLLLHETAARIPHVRLTRVFPLETPARIVWVFLGAAAAVALASARPDSNAIWTTHRPGNGIVMAGGKATGAAARGQTARNQAETAGDGTPGERHVGGTPLFDPSRRPPSDQSSSAGTRDSSTATALGTTPAGTGDVSTGPARANADGARANVGAGAGRRDGSRGAAAGDTRAGGAAGGAQGGLSGASSRTVSAGGLTSGSLTARLPDDRALVPLDRAAYAAMYAGAWSQAQIAMGSAHVPAATREYVKRYFASIRDGSK
jgi:hypothetical protein